MVFSRISSSLLRRNPFTSKSISSFSSISSISSSPSNNINLTTISKFHPQIFSNPRTTDFFQIRRYSGETQSLIAQGKKKQRKSPDPKKLKLAQYNRKVDLAYEAIERAEYSKGRVIFWPEYKRDAELANNAINIALKKYDEVLSILGEDERKDFEKARWLGRKQMLDIQEKTMNDELMNFEEVLKIWNKTAFGEENPKGSGGTAH
ncbi:hypothetical protein MKW92_053348 [Papaver armeniacum]|nr:hypothetical protein MKW92_053348 [Papaver armeniacum]